MSDVLTFIGQMLTQIMNIPLPWYNLKFGEIVIGVPFILLLLGVFKNIFTSINHDSGGDVKE